MKCPYCQSEKDKVLDSRPSEGGSVVRRRRECLSCHQRFTTFERLEQIPLIVVKRDGSRQLFNRDKIIEGLAKACEKTTISMEQYIEIAKDVEATLRNRLDQEVPTSKIGVLVMKKLREIDPVAYVRFASVYKQFKTVGEFQRELQKFKKKRKKD